MTEEVRRGGADGRSRAPVLVIALGGNAITRPGDEPSVQAQFARTRETMDELLPVVTSGDWRLVFTHGNGPQVGNILLRSDLAFEAHELPRLPLDAAVADTQGAMGYMIGQCLGNALWESGLQAPVATVVTQAIVDEDDPAFRDPTKPVGRFYTDDQVDSLRGHGWALKRDPQGRGWRRVVASPPPLEIVEIPVIRALLEAGVIVIACGGGGVPVHPDDAGSLTGLEAVIDKDLASSLLATQIGAATLAILTDVERVFVRYGEPDEEGLGEIDVAALRRLTRDGHFPSGSMGPKIEAVIGFVERGGERAIITSPERLTDALEGRAGTHVVASARAGATAS